MSNLNLAPLFAGRLAIGKIEIDRAIRMVGQAIEFMELAEEALDELRGNEKLQMVVDGVIGTLRYAFPDEVEDFFTEVAEALAPIVSMIVSIYNLRKLWPRQAKAA